ncbi:MAG: hypothetical protein BWX74_00120 [Tenericutes bacterium ADurb.Bin087]|nr:MAG: hypothetical protein BWX74_00120 [Tenericutes bacterium ADurb.Bin087]
MLKKYKFNLELWAIVLFAMILIPNLIWIIVPPAIDPLRVESITKGVDIATIIVQVLMIASLTLLANEEVEKVKLNPLLTTTIVMVLLYVVSWVMYYINLFNIVILLGLTLCPCVAIILYAIDRKNIFGLVFAALFTIGHFIFAFANFLCIVIPGACVY